MARAIDADAVKRRAWDIAEAWKGQGRNYEALLLESVVEQIVDTAPTLTPPDEPLTQADLDSMDYDKVWIDYGDDGEWALVVNGRIYCLAVLEGAGFEDILREELGGETLDRPSGDYTVYRRPTEVSP